MIEKIRLIVESLGYPFFFGTRDEVYAYINRVRTCVAVYRQGNATGASQSLVFKFKGEHPQKMYYDVFAELKKVLTIGVQRTFFYDDLLEVRCPVMAKTYTGGGSRPTPPAVSKILNFKAITASTISMKSNAATAPTLEYSTDGVNYLTWNHTTDNGYEVYDIINLAEGDIVYFRGSNATMGSGDNNYSKFIMTGSVEGAGSVMSLLDNTGESGIISYDYCFKRLFYQCTAMTKAPDLTATTLTKSCYDGMFNGCSNMVQGPVILANELGQHSFAYTFGNCSSLKKIVIPSEQAVPFGCFIATFYLCGQLSEIEVHVTGWTESYASGWVNGVSATGTFRKPSGTTIPEGINGIPSGWTVENF